MGNTDKFEMMAKVYDTPERMKIARLSADAIREYLVDTKDKRGMDFGCGTGLVGMNLIEEFDTVVFLDSAQNMIREVEQKISNHNLQNVKTICFDFERDQLSDLHADYIFMVQVLLHINDYELLLSRLYQVLSSGGHLIIVDFDKNKEIASDLVHNGFDQTELADVMRKVGFHNIQSKTFYSGNKIFMGQDASMFVLDAIK